MALYDEYLKKIFIIDHEELRFDKNDGWSLIGIPDFKMVRCLIISILSFVTIYFIEFNQIIRTRIFHWRLYQMSPMKMTLSVMQQRYVMKISSIRRVPLERIHSFILFRERGRKIQYTIATFLFWHQLHTFWPAHKTCIWVIEHHFNFFWFIHWKSIKGVYIKEGSDSYFKYLAWE